MALILLSVLWTDARPIGYPSAWTGFVGEGELLAFNSPVRTSKEAAT